MRKTTVIMAVSIQRHALDIAVGRAIAMSNNSELPTLVISRIEADSHLIKHWAGDVVVRMQRNHLINIYIPIPFQLDPWKVYLSPKGFVTIRQAEETVILARKAKLSPMANTRFATDDTNNNMIKLQTLILFLKDDS